MNFTRRYFIKFSLTVLLTWLVVIALWVTYSKIEIENFNKLRKNAVINPIKVFQIGFNKCGTTTIADFFAMNGVPTIHHDGGALPISIDRNFKAGRPLLSSRYAKILVFTDMEVVYKEPQVNAGAQYFKELDKQYPGSKFILNIRDKNRWLKSRGLQLVEPSHETFLSSSARIQNISEAEMLQTWSVEWDKHYAEVIEYFKNRPNDLLIFNIEHDKAEKIVEFFKHDFRLNPKLYKHKNKTASNMVQKAIKWMQGTWITLNAPQKRVIALPRVSLASFRKQQDAQTENLL